MPYLFYMYFVLYTVRHSQICNICIVNILLSRSWYYAGKIIFKIET